MRRVEVLIRYFFNLQSDSDKEENVINNIRNGMQFRGANLWTLIFAIIIASVGLNVNSTAVVIGAMLISPLMGPIMGVGLGLGIRDFDIVRKAMKNLATATVISVATSAIYFWLSPLNTASSELLARTTPTIWDVFIAFAGGLAGIVGMTRKEKSNVIPGVAIATALMPPLCTAGFGIATGHWLYFLGAIYLFFINSVFICIATVLIVRYLGFHKREYEDEGKRRRMTRNLIIVVVLTVAPSIWLAYRIVQKAFFENAAQTFVSKEFNFQNTQVISKNFVYESKHPRIELLLIGRPLDTPTITELKTRMKSYHLGNAKLVVRQGLDAKQEIDFSQIKASIFEDVFRHTDSIYERQSAPAPPVAEPTDNLKPELAALFPQIRSYSVSWAQFVPTDTLKASDSIRLVVANSGAPMTTQELNRMEEWLRSRFKGDSVEVIYRRTR